jgi:hypothetical protein
MDAVRTTDFFAVIPVVGAAPEVVVSQRLLDEAARQRVTADVALLVLMFTAALMVASVIFNWSY